MLTNTKTVAVFIAALIIVLFLAVATPSKPLVAQERVDVTGWRSGLTAWSASMGRLFRSFTPTSQQTSHNIATHTTPTPPSYPGNGSAAAAMPTDGEVATPSSRLSADVLKANLAAKSPSEAAYLDDVAARRDRGAISDRAVNSAYRYAMKKNRDRRVQYFEAAINATMR